MKVEDIIITPELARRPARPQKFRAENRLLRLIGAQLGMPSRALLDKVVNSARAFCGAGSAGLSLLEIDARGKEIFRWASMAGAYADFVGGTTPADFSPCGTCLERNSPQLYRKPARYFTYFSKVCPEIHEGLVVPVVIGREKLGTLWIVSHDQSRLFDGEDVRAMTNLASFTAAILRQSNLQTSLAAAVGEARKNADFCRHVLSQSPDCIKVLDDNGRVLYINEPGLKLLGVQPPEVLKKNWTGFWKGRDKEAAKEALRIARTGKEHSFQGFRPTARGEPKWWDVVIAPLSKRPERTYLVISRDVTERTVAARKLAEAHEQLAERAATLEQRVQERTHELSAASERLQGLARKLVRSQEDERRAVARELHDEIGQQLTALKLLLERGARGAGEQAQSCAMGASAVARLQRQVQTLSFSLRQFLPDHLTLRAALAWHLKEVEQMAPLKLRFDCSELIEEQLGPEIRHTVFRIVQESLTNIVRHSGARTARVALRGGNGTVSLEISDRGTGFSPWTASRKTSTGISGMEERVLLLGGRFLLTSRPGAGTRVQVTLPCAI